MRIALQRMRHAPATLDRASAARAMNSPAPAFRRESGQRHLDRCSPGLRAAQLPDFPARKRSAHSQGHFENCSSKNAACACHAGSRVSGASGEFSGIGIPARKWATSFGPVFNGIARGATSGFSCAQTVSPLARPRAIDRAVQFFFMASDHGVFARRNRAADPTAPLPNRPAIPQCASAIDKTSSKS